MTLDTRIYVHDPIAPRAVFDRCNQLLGVRGPDVTDDQEPTWRGGVRIIEPDSPKTLMNEPGQGFPAWLMLHYRPGAPLRTPEQAAEHEDWCDDDCDGVGHRPACWLEVSLDTSYGYSENGENAGGLHARLIAELGQWLDDQDVTWPWKNEFTGDVHGNNERYRRLADLAGQAGEASDWLRSILPAILAKAAATREAGQ